MKQTAKNYIIYDSTGRPVDIMPALPDWINRKSLERVIVEEWGIYSNPEDDEQFPELIGIADNAPDSVRAMYDRYIARQKDDSGISAAEEAENPYSRWNTPPKIIKTTSKSTPEQQALAKQINAQRAAAAKAKAKAD